MKCKGSIKLFLSGIALVQASSFLVQRHFNVITSGTVGASDIKSLDDAATSRILEGTIHTKNTLIGNDMDAITQGLAKALKIDGGSISVVKRLQHRSAQELERLSKRIDTARAFATEVRAKLHASSQKVERTAKEKQVAVTRHLTAVTHLKNVTMTLNEAVATMNKTCKEAANAAQALANLKNNVEGKLVAAQIILRAKAKAQVAAIFARDRLLKANNGAQEAVQNAAKLQGQAMDAMYDAQAKAANQTANAAKAAASAAAQKAADAKAAAEAKQQSNLIAAGEANKKAMQSEQEAKEAAREAAIAHADLVRAEEQEEGADWALLNATEKQKRRQDKADAAVAEAKRLQGRADRAAASRQKMEGLAAAADVKLAQDLAKAEALTPEMAEEQKEAAARLKTAAELEAKAKGGGQGFGAAEDDDADAKRLAQSAQDAAAKAKIANDRAEGYDGSETSGSGGNAVAIASAAATAAAASAAANTAAATADAAAKAAKVADAAAAVARGIGSKAVGPRSGDGCAERVVITGAEDVQADFMGVFYRSKDQTTAAHSNRILYENTHGKTLYFWADSGNWLIDNSDSISDGKSVLYSKADVECPSDAVGWGTWDGAAWTTTKYPVRVSEAAVDMCAEAITISGASATLPSFMGTYRMTQDIAGAEHRGRAAYKNEEGREGVLHFESSTENWIITKSGNATQALNNGKGYIYASTSMECPSSVKGWKIWDETENQYVSSTVTIRSLTGSASASLTPAEASALPASSSSSSPTNPLPPSLAQTGNQPTLLKKADTSAEQSNMDVETEILLDFTILLPPESSISEFIKKTFPSPTDARDQKQRFLKKMEDAENEEFEMRHGLATIGQETIGLSHGEEPLKFASLELFCEPGVCEFETLKIEG